MNIVFLSRLFYPHIGGVETHVYEISRLLIAKGHRVTVITELRERLEKREGIDGLEIVRIKVGRDDFLKKFRIWKALGSKLRLLKQADIVHCHDVFFWYLPFRFLFFNKPVYTTFHGFEGKFPVSKKAILIRKISEKLSYGNICVGEFIKKWYGTKPNYVTYGGVGQFSIFNFQFSKKKNEKLKILFVGRLDEDTGILEYLKVLEELKKRNIRFEFEVYGDGELKSKVQKYGKVNGFISKPEQFMSSADIVFTSSYLSILATMALGKPIFAMYDNPLKKDYLTMTPFAKWMYISDNPKDVVERIVQNKNLNMKEASQWAQKQTWSSVYEIYRKLWSIV